MSKVLVFVCFLASLSWCAGDAVDYTFQITPVDSSIVCKNNNKDNPDSITIINGQSVNLDASPSPNPAFIYMCKSNRMEDIVTTDENTKLLKSTVEVPVHKDIGGIWNCTILTNKGGQIKPILYYDGRTSRNGRPGNYSYSVVHCFLRVHVRIPDKTLQTVLVNNMVLPTFQSSNLNTAYDHSAVYYYAEEDVVTVSCIIDSNSSNKYYLYFNYSYTEKYNFPDLKDRQNKYNLPENFLNRTGTLGLAFRTTLGAEHDQSVLICKCYDEYDYTTISVKFERQQFSDAGKLAVNRHIARMDDKIQSGEFETYNYMFCKDYPVKIECYTDSNTYTNKSDCMSPKEEPNVHCYECNGKKYIYKQTEMESYFSVSERKSLTTNLTDFLMEIYDYDDEFKGNHFSWKYYAYDDGDFFALQFFKPAFPLPPSEIFCKLNSEGTPSFNSQFSAILTSEYDKSVLCCELADAATHNKIFTLYIQFVMKPKTTTSTTTSTTSATNTNKGIYPKSNIETTTPRFGNSPRVDSDLVIPIVAVLMILVIVIVIMVIYRMRKRNQMRETDCNEILQSPSETSIPAYPPQWTATEEQNYHVPLDLRKDNNVYAVPVNAKESPYAVPIPKSKRKDKGNNDLIYAELNLSNKAGNSKSNEATYSNNEPTYAQLNAPFAKNSNNEEPTYAAVTDLYAHVNAKDKRKNQGNTELYSQVLPKGARRNKDEYGNVFPDSPYVNSSGAEYVEPTYIEAPRK